MLPSVFFKVKVLVAQSCPILRNPMGCSLPGSSVHGVFQARILEWVAIFFSRGASQVGLNLILLHCRQIFFFFYCLSHQGSQKVPKNPAFEQQQCWWSSWLWLWVLFFFLLKDPILALMHLVQVFAIVEVWCSTFPLSMGLSRCLSRRWPLKDACSSSWARR